MAFDAARAVTVLFGGADSYHGAGNGETWEWNGTVWTRRVVSGPSPRVWHAMAYDPARAVTVFFGGGIDDNSVLGDTWEWNGTVWTQRSISGPAARNDHAMAFDAVRGVTVLFGGYTDDGQNNETWVLGINCPADFNHSGAVNSQDFFDFLAAYFSLAPAADFNHSGTVNPQDFFDFLAVFLAGCP
jgi:hypothetical protein